ncbi:MAG: TM2 domain-containing protein [Bacteroidales bacterium]|nr:TM2 domain-containing protein [Bacteroidales bacterium]
MENQKIDSFLALKGDYFPSSKISIIREKLAAASDAKSDIVHFYEYKNPTVMLIVSIFIGQLGIDRFMLGDIGLGVLKLITGGGCGIWWLVDLFTVQDRAREYNFKKLIEVLW